VGYPTLEEVLSQSQFILELSNDGVALARGFFEFPAVQNLHCASDVFYDSLFLESRCCQANGGPVRTHHGRDEVMRDRKHSQIHPILGH